MFIKILSIAMSTTVQSTDVKTLSVFQKNLPISETLRSTTLNLVAETLSTLKTKTIACMQTQN